MLCKFQTIHVFLLFVEIESTKECGSFFSVAFFECGQLTSILNKNKYTNLRNNLVNLKMESPWNLPSYLSDAKTLIAMVVLDSVLSPSSVSSLSSGSDSYSNLSDGGSTSCPTADRNRERKNSKEKRYSCCTLLNDRKSENIITARLARGKNNSRRPRSLLKLTRVCVRRFVTCYQS